MVFDRLIQPASEAPMMTEVARLRDSTQILLPRSTVSDFRGDLEERFMVTICQEESRVRIIGSPTEIKSVNDFLARHGVAVA